VRGGATDELGLGDGSATLDFAVALEGRAGAVTPGIASMGRTWAAAETGEATAAGGFTGTGGLAVDWGERDALAFGWSGSEAGGSRGGGSWASARLAPKRKNPSDPTSIERNIVQWSRMVSTRGE